MKYKYLFVTILIFLLSSCGPKSYPEGTVADFLAKDGRFTTYLEITDEVILESAPPVLVDTEHSFTFFVPTDEAFESLPPELVKQLKDDPGMAQIFLFHHSFDVPRYSKDFGMVDTWPTISTFNRVSFEFDGDQIRYDGAQIIEKDIQVGNNVIHVINAVTGLDLLSK